MILTYRIDSHDRLVEVNDEWKHFALANDAPELIDGVLNRPLWEFISDPTTLNVYHHLLSRVRGGRTINFPFRCDSPSIRRWMRMRMSASPDGEVVFESTVVDSQPFDAGKVWDRRATRGTDLLTSCSWCKRLKVEDRWEEVEEAIGPLGMFMRDPVPLMTHGMCSQCYAGMMESLDALDSPR
jgi:hypothetical protein